MPVRPPTHGATRRQREHKAQRQADDRARGTATQRGYDSRWTRAAKGFLVKHPLCAECERQGRITAATDVDHIIPHKGDKILFWTRSNWQGLCHPCHSTKTAREDGGFGNANRYRSGSRS